MKKRIILASDFSLHPNAEGVPALSVSIDDMAIENPFLSSCGRFDVKDPEMEYGIPLELSKAIVKINEAIALYSSQEANIPTILAKEFCNELCKTLGSQLDAAALLNDAEPNPSICHTHDFCDPNQLMLDAMEVIGLRDDMSVSGEFVSKAWAIAKSAKFDISKI